MRFFLNAFLNNFGIFGKFWNFWIILEFLEHFWRFMVISGAKSPQETQIKHNFLFDLNKNHLAYSLIALKISDFCSSQIKSYAKLTVLFLHVCL